MTSQLKQFVFKGMLARHSVVDMQSEGLLRQPSSLAIERDDVDLYASVEEKTRNSSLQMQRAYRLLFVLENIVRNLIVERFEEPDGVNWFERRATTQMKTKVAQRKEQEDKNQWHSGRSRGEVFYLDFGDLSKLITNHWVLFEDLLPTQSWVQSRLDEAERSRNVIAHTNVLASEEIGRLELYLRDWIRQIG